MCWAVSLQICEWTGSCGDIDGSDCSNKCIASAEILSSAVRIGDGAIRSNGVLYCHMLATTIARAHGFVQEEAGNAIAPPAPGCPSDEVINAVADSPIFLAIAQPPLQGRSKPGTSLFGTLRAFLLICGCMCELFW